MHTCSQDTFIVSLLSGIHQIWSTHDWCYIYIKEIRSVGCSSNKNILIGMQSIYIVTVISCTIDTCNFPDMYTPKPQPYISGKSLVTIHVIKGIRNNCNTWNCVIAGRQCTCLTCGMFMNRSATSPITSTAIEQAGPSTINLVGCDESVCWIRW